MIQRAYFETITKRIPVETFLKSDLRELFE